MDHVQDALRKTSRQEELGQALGVDLAYIGIVPIQREMGLQLPDPEPQPMPVLIGPAHP